MGGAGSIGSERSIPHLPAVTVGAVVRAPCPDLRDALDMRQLVPHPHGQQQDARLARRASGRDAESGGRLVRLLDSDLPDDDALIRSKLLLRGATQLKRWGAVVAEEPVHAVAHAVRRVV
jgi:hypothetical protein